MGRLFSLGSIQFGTNPSDPASAMQVPDRLTTPWRTLGTVHDIPQDAGTPARRVGQTFGVVPDQIEFEARFAGDNAQQLVDQIVALQAAQVVVPFAVGSTTYDVLVWRFEPTLEGATNDIHWKVILQPLASRRVTSTSSVPDPSASLDAATLALSGLLQTPPVDTSALDVLPNLSSVPAQAAALGSPANASAASMLSLATTLAAGVVEAAALVQANRGKTLNSNAYATYQWARAAQVAAQNMLTTVRTYTGQQQRLVLPGAMNAYEIAANYTGSVNNVDAIMRVNNISDPFALDPMTPIAIPNTLS